MQQLGYEIRSIEVFGYDLIILVISRFNSDFWSGLLRTKAACLAFSAVMRESLLKKRMIKKITVAIMRKSSTFCKKEP